MQITINGEICGMEKDLSIADLLAKKKLNANSVVIEYNGNILDKGTHNKTAIKNGDVLEIVHFVGGGR